MKGKWTPHIITVMALVVFVALGSACASKPEQAASPVESSGGMLTLDQALKEASVRIDERVAAKTKIAPLNFNSPHDKFSGYVLDEVTANLVDSGKLTVVDRKEVDLIRGEFNFQFSGEVGDDSMQQLGRMLGAQSIISGSLTDMGGFYRIVIRVLNVQNASVEVQYRANIASDNIMAALLTGGKTASVASAPQRAPAAPAAQAPAAVPVQAAPAPTPPKRGTVYSGNGHSYEVIDQTMPWTDAKRYCERLDGHLATITSAGEQMFIENLLARGGGKNIYWLGGFCGYDRKYQWVTDEPFVYTNWAPGEPNYDGGKADKIVLFRIAAPNNTQSRPGQWNDLSNWDSSGDDWWRNVGFVCEWD